VPDSEDEESFSELKERARKLDERVREHLEMIGLLPKTPEGTPRRATYRFRDYTIGADESPDAEPIVFHMECVNCGQSGPSSDTADNSTDWAAGHLKANPAHLFYREHITRPYRADPGAWR
jgi:hypothetical protein